jgi:hypothetical protein
MSTDTDFFYISDEMTPLTHASFAQHLVQNAHRANDYELDVHVIDALEKELDELFTISEEQPMMIMIFHDGCMTHADYKVTSAKELLTYMLDNYAEFTDE